MKRTLTITAALLVAAGIVCAQEQGGERDRSERGGGQGRDMGMRGSRMGDRPGGGREAGGHGSFQRGGHPGGEGHGREEMMERLLESPEVRERLGLSEEQVEKIKKELLDIKMEMVELKAEMEKVGLEQAKAMTSKEIDEDELMDLVEKAGKLRTKMAKLQIKKLVLFRKNIDPEKMQGMRDQLRERMRDRMKERDQDRDQDRDRDREGVGRQGGDSRRRPGMEGGRRRPAPPPEDEAPPAEGLVE